MKCVVLCGDKGEKLRSLSLHTNKAYLPMSSRCVINCVISILSDGMPYTASMNDGGALCAFVETCIGDEPLMVAYGENYFDCKLDGFITACWGGHNGVYDIKD